jgi:DNA-binding beta-propeller fold protein YncE
MKAVTLTGVTSLLILALAIGLNFQRPAATTAVDQQDPPSTQAETSPIVQFTAAVTPPATGPQDPDHPFQRRIDFPFEFPDSAEWLNTSGKIRMKDLRGKFVLMDFWTYCCINCMHILPELKKLEQKYPNELVVIGVHSAKFETEKDVDNIKDAILRHDIEHPVVNDPELEIWRSIGINAWPTLLLIDPTGQAVWIKSGETQAEIIDAILKEALPYYRKNGLLDDTPTHFDLHAVDAPATPLRFPGKILGDASSNRLFIADSSHNRIVISDLDGKLIDVVGSGVVGSQDGDYATAQFNKPQGMVLNGDWLYVADTENHMLRKINLVDKTVKTIAGTGKQATTAFPGMDRLTQLPTRWTGKPKVTSISSPWALWIRNDEMYIAMAGPHMIWKMPLDESEIYPYAGNAREDIVDGPLLPRRPYDLGFASFAQPSGLAADDEWLYVADSEGSSIRAVPFNPRDKVRTVVGTSKLPSARLFTFGDRDGDRERVLLQHCIGVTYDGGLLYVADTYNNKIKVVDAKTGSTATLAGDGEPGLSDQPARFDEPAGLHFCNGKIYVADTNNHAIRIVDPKTGATTTLEIEGLTPPVKPARPERPTFDSAEKVTLDVQPVKVVDGKVSFNVEFKLPPTWKINPIAPMAYYLDGAKAAGVVDTAQLPKESIKVDPPQGSFEITVPVTEAGQGIVKVSTNYYYCQEGGEGLCKVGSVVWTVPFVAEADSDQATGSIPLQVKPGF